MCPDSLNGPPLFLIGFLLSPLLVRMVLLNYHDVKRFKYVWICTEMIV